MSGLDELYGAVGDRLSVQERSGGFFERGDGGGLALMERFDRQHCLGADGFELSGVLAPVAVAGGCRPAGVRAEPRLASPGI